MSHIKKPPLGSKISWGHPLSRGLVGRWLLNEGAGSRANDLTFNGNHLNFDGNFDPEWKGTARGRTLHFDSGDDDYIFADVGGAELVITGDVTVSCWANYDSLTSGIFKNMMMSHHGDGEAEAANFVYGMYLDGATKQLSWIHEYGGGTNNVENSGVSAPVNADEWHMYSAVRDDTAKTVTFYVDAEQNGFVRGYTNSATGGGVGQFTVSGFHSSANFAWKGEIDDPQVFNRPLSRMELRMALLDRYANLLKPQVWSLHVPAAAGAPYVRHEMTGGHEALSGGMQ